MQYMLADVDQVRAFVYGSSIQVDAEKVAIALLSWSRRMAELFPPGQASTDYADMSVERVRGAPEAMSRSAEILLTTVRTGGLLLAISLRRLRGRVVATAISVEHARWERVV
jgi:hypothetical protein